ncbi:hypothetical protein BDZ97DRAFT_1049949 [Flammula alnicola]|nr:hypothetical protein BDZ97DRAFT_1049949 [Flammula alnicola]
MWAAVDDVTGMWFGGVVPSNRMKDPIGCICLRLLEKYCEIPLQTATDRGTETVQVYGIGNALRQMLHHEYDMNVLPAPSHFYLRNICNITIERSWLRQCLDFANNGHTVLDES